MRRFVLFAILLSLYQIDFAQWNFSIEYIYVHHRPTPDFSEDTVSLVLKNVTLPYPGGLYSTLVERYNDSLNVLACYWPNGNATVPSVHTDTIPLGIYTEGIYEIYLILGMSSYLDFDSCSDYRLRDTFNVSFPVVGPLDIPNNNRVTGLRVDNPVHQTIGVHLTSYENKELMFTLFDFSGRLLKQEPILSINTNIDRGNISNGIYFWILESEGKVLDKGRIIFE